MPPLHSFLANNPFFRILPHQTFGFVKFAREGVNERLTEYNPSSTDHPGLFAHFIGPRKAYPDVVTDYQVFVYGLTYVIAGSLSTSHVLDELVKYWPRIRTHKNGSVTKSNLQAKMKFPDLI
jgi:hypothetical protein